MEIRDRKRSPVMEISPGDRTRVDSFSSNSNVSTEDDVDQLSNDLNNLDANERDEERKQIYKKNKVLFLVQSSLLGISYSIIWPTLWTYVTQEFTLSTKLEDLVYGLTYVAYPIGSMLSAKIVESMDLSTKYMVLLLNMLEIIGNLVYTLTFFPGLTVVGRFVAGLGDAFYVVLMKEMKSSRGIPDEKMTIECLAAFIVGVVLSPGINIVTTFLKFKLGLWVLNPNTYPGLTTSVLFLLMQFVILIFLKEEKNNTSFGPIYASSSSATTGTTSRFIEVTNMIKESPITIWYVNCYAFIYTYIVAMLELMIPIIMYEVLNASQRELMILYAVIGTVYAMLLMMTMTVTFDYQPETFVCISVIFQIVGLFALIYFSWLGPYQTVPDVIGMGALVISLATLWSSDDVLFINFVQIFVPYQQRENTHTARKFMSKVAFALAGVTVPFLYRHAMIIVAPIIIVAVCALFVLFIIVRFLILKKGL